MIYLDSPLPQPSDLAEKVNISLDSIQSIWNTLNTLVSTSGGIHVISVGVVGTPSLNAGNSTIVTVPFFNTMADTHYTAVAAARATGLAATIQNETRTTSSVDVLLVASSAVAPSEVIVVAYE